MRISTDKNDAGYENWVEGKDRVVYLNGEKVENGVMADEEEGVVIVIRMDENNCPILLDANNEKAKPYGKRIHQAIELLRELFNECGKDHHIAKTTLYGKVEIKDKED